MFENLSAIISLTPAVIKLFGIFLILKDIEITIRIIKEVRGK